MKKQEFEQLVGTTVSDEDYNIIEKVYHYYPFFRRISGKEEAVRLYKEFGMTIFRDLFPRAEKIWTETRQLSRAYFQHYDGGFASTLTEKHCEDLINQQVRAKTGIEKLVQDLTQKDAGVILAILGLDHPASKVIFKYLVKQKKEQCSLISFLMTDQK